ncbi:MAG: HNH endonuclease [Flavobacteriales bacterium]|nr:HNH endonuclease [Flavobacteriales bacterium]HQW40362.1 HNH endonuclease [Flavobacteriales bacterium]
MDIVFERSPEEVGPEYANGPHALAVQVNRYEHEPMARAKCIRAHGPLCAVCNVDLEQMYGTLGKQAIRVHHIHPLHTLAAGYVLDPVDDLVPVCPNCHLIMHRGRDQALSVEQLRRIIALNGAQRVKARMAQGY